MVGVAALMQKARTSLARVAVVEELGSSTTMRF
jgi:hypothetical protein